MWLSVATILLSVASIALIYFGYGRLGTVALAIAVIVTVLNFSAHAEDWRFASSNKAGDIFEIDLDTLTVWQDQSVSVKVEVNGDEPIVQNFDCSGHYIVLAPPNNIGVQHVVQHSSTATIERKVCALRDRVLAEAK